MMFADASKTMSKSITRIHKDDLQGPFITPPEYGGQMCQYSYACTNECIVECYTDAASDDPASYVAYRWSVRGGRCEPWNGRPSLGRRLGPAEIIG